MKCSHCHSDNPETVKFCGECGTPLLSAGPARPIVTETLHAPAQELATGSTFAGRYQIIEELGKGGMGRVYKVFDTHIREKVALKLLKPEIASDPETIERFSNELKLARKIRHKNVCGMYDLGRAEGAHFLTMEYVPGEDLKTMIRMSGSLTVGATLSIGKQVCDGLAEAHSLGVVHRDLKPQNIMIDRGGNAKIMDFGIARSLREKGLTGRNVLIGTPAYMSPEQAEAKEVDERSDIYSLGVILYEMATGRVPFGGETALGIALKHKTEMPKSPKQLNPHIPDDLSGIILKCLEKDPAKRYQTAAAVGGDLDRIEKGMPTTERVVPERKTLTSREITVTFRLRKLLVPAAAVTAVVLAALFVWHPWARKGGAPPAASGKPSLAVVYFENDTGDAKLDHWRKGISDLLITDLTQSRYLKVLGGDRLSTILGNMGQLEAKSFSSELLKEVAVQGGVDRIARGSYSKAGDLLRIDMTLQDARSGEPIATHRVEGKGEESIFSMVDELTRWTKASLNLSAEQLAGDINTKVGQLTTSSPEAYKLYLEGRSAFWGRQWQRSIEFMEKAIALDPGFASAYSTMGVAYGNMGQQEGRRKYLQEALRLSDRLPEREKLRIQGANFQSRSSTYDKAIATYEKLISLYPESSEAVNAHHNLGVLYDQIEDWDKSVENYEAAIKAGTKFGSTFFQAARSHMAKGQYERAKTILEDLARRFPDNVLGPWQLAKWYALQGQFDRALTEADKAAAIDPTYTRGRFHHVMWDFVRAEETYKRWLGFISEEEHLKAREQLECLYRTLGKFEAAKGQALQGIELVEQVSSNLHRPYLYYALAYDHLRSGRYREALEAVEKSGLSGRVANQDTEASGEVDLQFRILELKGWICAEMGRPAEAKAAAEEIKGRVDTSLFKKRIRHHHFLTGMIRLKAKDFPGAIESFKNAVSLLPQPFDLNSDNAFYMYQLARAYQEFGDLEKAREEFEGIVALIGGRTNWGDLYALSYYRLGLIYDKLGNTAKARENYGKFLDLWKDADPGLPEVADARTKLAGLVPK